MACGRKPTCGSQGGAFGVGVGTVGSDIIWILGSAGTVGTAFGVAEKLLGLSNSVSVAGIAAPVAVWLAAVAAALVTLAVVFDFWRLRCLAHPDTLQACSAGVISNIVPAFNSASDEVFPFTAMHDRVDVVVKCVYWFLVENNAGWVWCSDDAEGSPILRGYYHNDQVCAAGAGSFVGGIAGAVGGIIAGCIIGAAIGCATIILCIFAIIIAAIVAAVAVLVGALVGGQIGKAAAGSSTPQAGGTTVTVGDYVTECGGVLTSSDDQNARVYWFVDPDHSSLHGRSSAMPPFAHDDPDANLVPDACGTSRDCPPP